jgi:hypothetical protein
MEMIKDFYKRLLDHHPTPKPHRNAPNSTTPYLDPTYSGAHLRIRVPLRAGKRLRLGGQKKNPAFFKDRA